MMQLRDLKTADLFRLFRVRLKDAEQASLAQRDQLSVGQNARAAPKNRRRGRAVRRPAFIALPELFAGLEVHAPKARVRFVAPAERIEAALIVNGSRPVRFQ